jgi:hypothetical protein
MQRLLAMHVPLLVTTEYRSSQLSACCHAKMEEKRGKAQTCRTTAKKCTQCSTMLGRDASAAHIIADIFVELTLAQSTDIPDWAKRKV